MFTLMKSTVTVQAYTCISTILTWVTKFFYFQLIRNVHIIHSNISITMMFAHNPLPLLSWLHNIFTCFSSPLIYRVPWVIDFKPIISFGTCIFGKYRCIGFKLQLVGKPRRENYKKRCYFQTAEHKTPLNTLPLVMEVSLWLLKKFPSWNGTSRFITVSTISYN